MLVDHDLGDRLIGEQLLERSEPQNFIERLGDKLCLGDPARDLPAHFVQNAEENLLRSASEIGIRHPRDVAAPEVQALEQQTVRFAAKVVRAHRFAVH